MTYTTFTRRMSERDNVRLDQDFHTPFLRNKFLKFLGHFYDGPFYGNESCMDTLKLKCCLEN